MELILKEHTDKDNIINKQVRSCQFLQIFIIDSPNRLGLSLRLSVMKYKNLFSAPSHY